LLKGQTRNGRAAGVSDYRQTVPGKSIPRDNVSFSTLSTAGSGGITTPGGRAKSQFSLSYIGRQYSAPAATKFSSLNNSNSSSNHSGNNSILLRDHSVISNTNSNNSNGFSSRSRPHSLAGDRRYSVTEKDKFYSKSNSVSNFRNVTSSASSYQHQQHPHHHQHHVHHHHHPRYPHVIGNSRPVIVARASVNNKSNSLSLNNDNGNVGRVVVPSGSQSTRTTIPNNIMNGRNNNGSGSSISNNKRLGKRDQQNFEIQNVKVVGTREMLIPSAQRAERVHHSLDRNVSHRGSYRSPAEMHSKYHRISGSSGHASDGGSAPNNRESQKAMRRRSLTTVEVEGLIKV